RKVRQVKHPHLQPHGDALAQFLLQDGFCLPRIGKAHMLDLDAEAAGHAVEDGTGHGPITKTRREIDLDERQVGKKQARAYAESHRFGNRYAVVGHQIGNDAVLAMSGLFVLEVYLHSASAGLNEVSCSGLISNTLAYLAKVRALSFRKRLGLKWRFTKKRWMPT